MTPPRVTRLLITPIKGFALDAPDAIELDATGAVGDRDLLLCDDAGAVVSITKTGRLVALRPSLADGVLRLDHADGRRWEAELVLGAAIEVTHCGREIPGRVVDGPWATLLSGFAGRSVRLVKCERPGDGSDLHPVTVLGDASVADLASAAGLDGLDPRRFRMTIGFDGLRPYAEEDWMGRDVQAGTARLHIGLTVPRCVGTTRHPDQGDRDTPVVRELVRHRGLQETGYGRGAPLGVYAEVVTPGRVAVGDVLTLP